MPSNDARRAPAEHAVGPQNPAEPGPEGSSAPGRLSRRSLLQGAATAGAAGLAATALSAGPALAATGKPSAAGRPNRGGDPALPPGPIVVHVRNAKSGDIEVFYRTSQSRLRDKDLAARIVRAIG